LSQCKDLRVGVTIMRKFRYYNDSACKIVLNLLEAICLRLSFTNIVIERVEVVKFKVDKWTMMQQGHGLVTDLLWLYFVQLFEL